MHAEREEVGYRDGQLVEGLRSVCVLEVLQESIMPH